MFPDGVGAASAAAVLGQAGAGDGGAAAAAALAASKPHETSPGFSGAKKVRSAVSACHLTRLPCGSLQDLFVVIMGTTAR